MRSTMNLHDVASVKVEDHVYHSDDGQRVYPATTYLFIMADGSEFHLCAFKEALDGQA